MSTLPVRLAVRFVLVMLLALLAGGLISEVSYRLMGGGTRQARDFELVIPEGTAEQVAKGKPVPSLPSQLTFVEGDSILVVNQDVSDHQLGPVWVPAGTTGRLSLDRPREYTVACSFQPSNELALSVSPKVNSVDRLQAVISIGLPTGVLAWLFSLVLVPLKGLDLS